MSSIIEGYKYDIFISYRQKDNKGDRWVSEFVEALKTELESTFKEDISVYFDINPHDGLLETHDVDASLKEKLECLIFIPIISRTYCDPKSFAWEHEFRAFIDMASKDQFGLKVRLPNGNVASRVLPVTIYDLDIADIKECESVLGIVLRGVEFIYKEPGVNRPLTPHDDENKNLNKTKYRNQINKVANAVKDIIKGIQEPDVISHTGETTITGNKTEKRKIPWGKLAVPAAILISVLIVGLLILYPLIKRSQGSSSAIDKSVAVLPFTNLSNDPEQEYFTDGMVDEIIDRLFKIGDLKVISRTTSMRYKNTTLSLKEIARELNVSAILEGSVRKMGNNVRITVQLIDARTDTHLWSDIYDKDISDIFKIQSEVAQAVARELKAFIRPDEKQIIEKSPTENLQAYDYYLLGEYFRNQRTSESLWRAKILYEKSIEADSSFVKAYTGLAQCLGNLAFWSNLNPADAYPLSMNLAYKALEFDSLFAEAYMTIAAVYMFYEFDLIKAENYFKKALELNPNNPDIYKIYAESIALNGRYSEAVEMDRRALEMDPLNNTLGNLYGLHLYLANQRDSAVNHLMRIAERNPLSHLYLGQIYLSEGDYNQAIKELGLLKTGFSPFPITLLGLAYSKSGNLRETRRMLDTMEYRSEDEYVPFCMRGALLAELGNEKKALEYLKMAYQNKEEYLLVLLYVDKLSYSSLRNTSEYSEIMGKIKAEK